MKNKPLHGKLISAFSIGIFILIMTVVTSVHAVTTQDPDGESVSPVSYEFDNGDYYFSASEPIAMMSFGKQAIGSLIVSGHLTGSTEFNGVQAFGVQDGQVSFSYVYDDMFISEDNPYHVISDKGNKIDGIKLSAKIEKGALLIQKSSNGDSWEFCANPVLNLFESNRSGITDFYTPDGTDVAKGCYYRVIIAYKMNDSENVQRDGFFQSIGSFFSNAINSIDSDWGKAKDLRHLECYTFYVCSNSGDFVLHNLSTTKEDILSIAEDALLIDCLLAGETLTNGATTTDGFTLDTLGAALDVTVNGITAEDGDTFRVPGKYSVVARTNLGKETSKTVFIFNGGEDRGASVYFEDGFLVKGKRVYRGDSDYPTFSANSVIRIKAVPDEVPPMTGNVTNLDTGSVIVLPSNTRAEQTYQLEPGVYSATLYCGATTSGSLFCYSFHFRIIDEDSKPYVNFNTLSNRTELKDYVTKHYEVAVATTRGGFVYACFSSYEEAFAFAYDLQKRFVEIRDDGIYYINPDNRQQKIKFQSRNSVDRIKLTKQIVADARMNVEVAYFNPMVPFSYQPYEGNDSIDELETAILAQSCRVVVSPESRERLLARVPYINGFSFIQVEDYDVVSVLARHIEDGDVVSIDLGNLVDEQLTKTGFYEITETNKYGDKITYYVCFMAENQTESVWEMTEAGETSEVLITYSVTNHQERVFAADVASIKSIQNAFDEYAIATISAPDIYSYDLVCMVSELKNLVLYKGGNYYVTFTDRVGNSYQVVISISGIVPYAEAITDDSVSLTQLYNSLYLTPKADIDESEGETE